MLYLNCFFINLVIFYSNIKLNLNMFKWIKELFFGKEVKKNNKIKLDNFKELDRFNNSGEILIQSSNKVNTKKEFNEIIRYTSSNKNLSKNEVLNAIEINIKFLELLLNTLSNTIYINEFNKVEEMLTQSNTCKKIMMSIKNSQIFYKNTVSIIQRHTINIGKLVKYINQLESNGKL